MTYEDVFPLISGIANMGNTYLPDLFNVNHWLIIIFFALFSAYLFYILDRKGEPRKSKI
ncbi:hypothetical protein QUF64_13865 [Anaerolineales bacterium HSG6]|nr:hypothetical protein [Anaerolineales bacterium HSG6]MDM8531854.1 hypothetical protein [Anaerolineales bacterium HSG25]